ncbi:MAG: hypothetical protein ACOYN3_04735 [Acidimicrobiia bacterium]
MGQGKGAGRSAELRSRGASWSGVRLRPDLAILIAGIYYASTF